MAQGQKVLLIILDGWGIAPVWGGNAIAQAKPRFYQKLWREQPHSQLSASGVDVGLLPLIKGNSEAGHLNIGAGRVVLEGYTLVSERIRQQPLAHNQAILSAVANAKRRGRPVHIMGLFSSGGIHSHLDHLFNLIDTISAFKVNQLLHLFTDGRDSDPKSAPEFFDKLRRRLLHTKSVKVATVIGRWWAMDRDSRWERTKKAYQALVEGVGEMAVSPSQAIADAYRRGITDEFIAPTIINEPATSSSNSNQAILASRIKSDDSVIFFNFRSDRVRQLTQAIVLGKLGDTAVDHRLTNLTFITFMPYQAGLPVIPAFSPDIVKEPLALVLAKANRRQLHIGETEKYAHITYFFNGGIEQPLIGEDRLLIPSPRVPTYNLAPAMASAKIAQVAASRARSGQYDFIVVNFANPDMIGHTGLFEAAIQSVIATDQALAKLVPVAIDADYVVMITADHGNIEEMINPTTGEPDTEHTRNPVPLIIINPEKTVFKIRAGGILADLAPTILTMMDIEIPDSMTGRNLVIE